MRVFKQWKKGVNSEGGGFSLISCNFCVALFGGGDENKVKDNIDETDNTTLSTNSPSKESQQSSNSNTQKKVTENDMATESRGIYENEIDVVITDATACENVRYLIEDATLCVLDGVCCRRTCDDTDRNSLLPETCGGARRELRKRRHDRVHKHSQFCCTTISWGPDDEDDISVLQDPIIEESEYDGGLNRELSGGTPEHSVVTDDDAITPKHRNSFRSKHEKCCAYCGVTKEEAKSHLKMCSRCRSVYYCSKDCQSEDWYNTHKDACVSVHID